MIDDHGEILHEATVPTDVTKVHREIRFIKRRKFARVCLEAGPGLSLARGLGKLGYKVDIFETRQLSKFLSVRRNKTDILDAAGIAEAGRVAGSVISKVHLKSQECQEIGSRLTIRRHLVQARVRAINLLGRQLEYYGGRISACRSPAQLRLRVEAQIRLLFGRTPNALAMELRELLRRCEELLEQQQRMDRDLHRLAWSTDICRRLMAIPGVGPICALTFYAVISEPKRFRKSADIGPYLGMVPLVRQSGLAIRMGRISKMGNTTIRTLLVQAGITFLRCTEPTSALHAWTKRVEQRSGRMRSRIALARKLAMIMVAIWKSGGAYEHKLIATEA